MYPLMIMHYEIVNQNCFAPLHSFLLENNYLKFGNFSQTPLDQLISSFTQALLTGKLMLRLTRVKRTKVFGAKEVPGKFTQTTAKLAFAPSCVSGWRAIGIVGCIILAFRTNTPEMQTTSTKWILFRFWWTITCIRISEITRILWTCNFLPV